MGNIQGNVEGLHIWQTSNPSQALKKQRSSKINGDDDDDDTDIVQYHRHVISLYKSCAD